MLSDDEILRRLRAIRHSPTRERYARRVVGINTVAVVAGIHRVQVHHIASGASRLGRRSRIGLSKALTKLVRRQNDPDPNGASV